MPTRRNCHDHNKRKKHYNDVHVPLSSSRRRQQAYVYQARLRQLGYHGIAFCHTAYGRLDPARDDADVTLPWTDLLSPPLPASPSAAAKQDGIAACGRTDSFGTKIYRRLNVVVEELGDASRLLLPATNSSNAGDATNATIASLLRKYDIVSIQPMNEPVLQSICELLSQSASNIVVSGISSPSFLSSSSNINTNYIDIIVLEYATGSRGGMGLPYRLRNDYLARALQAGVTFELCYGAAVRDPKRRQGFLRALADFRSAYSGIQKKHAIMNKNQLHRRENGGAIKSDTKFPLILSSGPRQNYTSGTGDVGTLALRGPDDVWCLVYHFAGVDIRGTEEAGEDEKDESCMYYHSDNEKEKTVTLGGKRKRKKQQTVVMSATERVLARASDRASGVVFAARKHSSNQHGTRKCGWDSRSYVTGMKGMKPTGSDALKETPAGGDESDEGEDGDGSSRSKGASSLIDWLSQTLHKMANAERNNPGLVEISKEAEHETADLQDKAMGAVNAEVCNNGHSPSSDMPHLPCDVNRSSCSETRRGEEGPEDGFIAF